MTYYAAVPIEGATLRRIVRLLDGSPITEPRALPPERAVFTLGPNRPPQAWPWHTPHNPTLRVKLPKPKVELPPDDSAPSGAELAQRRTRLGDISQRDLAALCGLSRGLIAEIERGRRRHILSRLKIAGVLDRLETERGKGRRP